jgi:hypothetical protein
MNPEGSSHLRQDARDRRRTQQASKKAAAWASGSTDAVRCCRASLVREAEPPVRDGTVRRLRFVAGPGLALAANERTRSHRSAATFTSSRRSIFTRSGRRRGPGTAPCGPPEDLLRERGRPSRATKERWRAWRPPVNVLLLGNTSFRGLLEGAWRPRWCDLASTPAPGGGDRGFAVGAGRHALRRPDFAGTALVGARFA